MLIGEYKADLLPCPFCGQKPTHWENTVVNATIRCDCGIKLVLVKPRKWNDERAGLYAISLWNTRDGVSASSEQK